MKRYFINPNDGYLRAGWRILLFILIFSVINTSLMFIVHEIRGSLKAASTLWFTVLAASATIATLISRKYVDKGSFSSLGLKMNKFTILDILSGIINSAIIIAAMFFTMLITGLIQFQGFSWWTNNLGDNVFFSISILPFVIAIFWKHMIIAWWEELVFRGILFQNMIKGLGLLWSVLISSFIFGMAHSGNPNATILSTALVAIITPQLIYAYLKTQQLWLPIGLHLGWNFFQGLARFDVSGQSSNQIISQSNSTPVWLGGGDFGPEAGLIVLFTGLVTYTLIWFYSEWVKVKEILQLNLLTGNPVLFNKSHI